MSFEIRTCASIEDLRSAVSPIWQYFGRVPSDEQVEHFARVMPLERARTVWDGRQLVGGAGSFAFDLTVPGGRVPASGVTIVGVVPTHRRRGIMRALMRAELDLCRARGEPVAYLWASEDPIYGRFGFGIASFAAEIDLPRERAGFQGSFESFGEVELVPLAAAEPLVAPLYERVATATPGMFARTSAWWQARTLADPQWRRRDAGALQCAVLTARQQALAYALYRLNFEPEHGVNTGALVVVEAMGTSPQATRAIWRYLIDIDWTARVRAAFLPLDHPLLLLVAEPRRLRFTLREGIWTRLVDVGAALAARAFAAQASIVIEVSDEFCPWNSGRWRVGAGAIGRTDAAPDLSCDVSALGSVYLGGFTWARLAAALRVNELAPGAAARADAVFGHGPAPWCPEIF
jgi:predicted acetyltransferase